MPNVILLFPYLLVWKNMFLIVFYIHKHSNNTRIHIYERMHIILIYETMLRIARTAD